MDTVIYRFNTPIHTDINSRLPRWTDYRVNLNAHFHLTRASLANSNTIYIYVYGNTYESFRPELDLLQNLHIYRKHHTSKPYIDSLAIDDWPTENATFCVDRNTPHHFERMNFTLYVSLKRYLRQKCILSDRYASMCGYSSIRLLYPKHTQIRTKNHPNRDPAKSDKTYFARFRYMFCIANIEHYLRCTLLI